LAQIPATSTDPLLGEVLTAKAEVLRLAGAPGDAETALRRALQLFEDRRMTPLAERVRALLASLAEQHSPRRSRPPELPPTARTGDRPPSGSPPPVPRPAPRGRLPAPGLLPGVQHDVPLDLGKVPLVGDP